MRFRILHDDRSGDLAYLLAPPGTAEAVLVDPRPADLPLMQALLDDLGLRLRWVLRTHTHDGGRSQQVLTALQGLGVPVVQGEAVAQPGVMTPADGTELALGAETVRVWRTPGHTLGCLSFQWRDRLFCGGLLAVDSCPHQPVPADPAALWDSAQRLFTLPDETLLFAGHHRELHAVSTVLEQRRWHPRFSGVSRDCVLARYNPTVSVFS